MALHHWNTAVSGYPRPLQRSGAPCMEGWAWLWRIHAYLWGRLYSFQFHLVIELVTFLVAKLLYNLLFISVMHWKVYWFVLVIFRGAVFNLLCPSVCRSCYKKHIFISMFLKTSLSPLVHPCFLCPLADYGYCYHCHVSISLNSILYLRNFATNFYTILL